MDRLCDLIVRTVPKQLLINVRDRYPPAYPEAYARSFRDPLVAAHSSQFILPFNRLVLIEQVFLDAALKAGVSVQPETNSAQNYQYALATVGCFEFTTNSARSPHDPPKDSVYREQKAQINRFVPQLQLGFWKPKFGRPTDKIYGSFIHGPDQYYPDRHGFTYLSFPSKDNDEWVARYKLDDLIALYGGGGSLNQQADKAKPRWRSSKKEEQEGK